VGWLRVGVMIRQSLACVLLVASAAPHAVSAQGRMRAIVLREFGGPDVLRVEEVERPAPGPGELLVRVHAAAVNPVDAGIRAGRAAGLVGARVPYTPGFDISGVVAAVAPDVTGFGPGDEVFAMLDLRRGGGYAEYAIVKASEVAHKPARATHVEAAALPLVALTGWQALFETAALKPGETVLIHAGAGGVGSTAVQLARWKGARIIATASAPNHPFLRELGADVVIDYTTQRFEDVADSVDVVLDPVGGDTQVRSLAILRDGGRLVALAGLTPQARSAGRSPRIRTILVRPDSAQLRQIADLVDAGLLRPVVTHTFPLERAPGAHVQSETRHTRGKIVLRVVPESG